MDIKDIAGFFTLVL